MNNPDIEIFTGETVQNSVTASILINENSVIEGFEANSDFNAFINIHNQSSGAHKNLLGPIEQKLQTVETAQGNLAKKSDVPTKVSQLENDSNYLSNVSSKLDVSLSNLSSEGIELIKSYIPTRYQTLTPFCVNSGSIDESGNTDILFAPGSGKVVTNILPVATSNTTSLGAISPATLPNMAPGTYAIFNGGGLNFTSAWADNSVRTAVCTFNSPLAATDVECSFLLSAISRSGTSVVHNVGLILRYDDNSTQKILVNDGNPLEVSDYLVTYTPQNKPMLAISIEFTIYGQINTPRLELKAFNYPINVSVSKTVFFKNDKPIVATSASGITFTHKYLEPLDMSEKANGVYNIAVTPEGRELVGNIYRQNIAPASPKIGDTWLNTSVEPLTAFKFDGENWIEFNGVPIGSATMQNGVITKIEHFPFNQNHNNVNWQTTGFGCPDYTKGVQKAWATMHIADSDGHIRFLAVTLGNGTYGVPSAACVVCTINGVIAASPFWNSSTAAAYIDQQLKISKGDVYILQGGGAQATYPSSQKLTFYPAKEAS